MTSKPAAAKRSAASANRAPVRMARRVGSSVAERVDPAADLVDAGHDALVGERELHDAAIERPRPHPDARSEPGVHRMSSDLHGC